jgi:Transposase DDE domain
LERRLQQRYVQMVESHAQASQALASGIHAVPDARSVFAATQAAHRFLNNPRVTLRALSKPLVKAARSEVAAACDRWALVVHDWSQLMYPTHGAKQDRVMLSSRGGPEGYELHTALVVSDRDGSPLAPISMSLRAADGIHCSRSARVRPTLSPLDELAPAMRFAQNELAPQPVVHLADAEADSVAHFREWSASGLFYLVRADDRLVEWEGSERRCSEVQSILRERGRFREVRPVEYHGTPVRQYVAEADVRLLRAGQRNRPQAGDRQRLPGPPLPLRLVLAEVRDDAGQTLATWRLVTNLPVDVDDATVALWYYWRWTIEKYFKLLKSAGMNAEAWQQESAHAITARLLVASMACVTIWRLARSSHPKADDARRFLVRLSGRQMKRSRPWTMPAMLAGMWNLLAMISVFDNYDPSELHQLIQIAFANPPPL